MKEATAKQKHGERETYPNSDLDVISELQN